MMQRQQQRQPRARGAAGDIGRPGAERVEQRQQVLGLLVALGRAGKADLRRAGISPVIDKDAEARLGQQHPQGAVRGEAAPAAGRDRDPWAALSQHLVDQFDAAYRDARHARSPFVSGTVARATCSWGPGRFRYVFSKRNSGGRRRMSEIQYRVAKNVKDACAAMAAAKGKGYILAGGTDLLVQMKSGTREPGTIVDVKKISEMVSITEKDGAFTVGAATPAAVIGEHKKLKKTWPGVVEAINLIGSTQVQGRASAGGNLCNASPAADSVPALVAAGAIATLPGPKGKRQGAGGPVCGRPRQQNPEEGGG